MLKYLWVGVTRSAKAVISGAVSALYCSDSLFLTISNVTEVTGSSLRQLFLALGGLRLYLTVFSLSLSAGFANTASYTHYVFQATTPVSIPSMPSEPPHSEDRISVSWQSPPVIYKGLPVRWLLLSFLFSSSQRQRLSPCKRGWKGSDPVSLVGSRLSLPACLSLSLGVFQKLHLHDFWFPVCDAFAKRRMLLLNSCYRLTTKELQTPSACQKDTVYHEYILWSGNCCYRPIVGIC